MKKFFLLFLIICSSLSLLSQRTEYRSRIYDGVNFTPIASANVYNYNSKEYSFSDEEGNFTIDAQENDTIIISKSIYRQAIFIISRSDLTNPKEYYIYPGDIFMKPNKSNVITYLTDQDEQRLLNNKNIIKDTIIESNVSQDQTTYVMSQDGEMIPIEGVDINSLKERRKDDAKRYDFLDREEDFTIQKDDTVIISRSIQKQFIYIISEKSIDPTDDQHFILPTDDENSHSLTLKKNDTLVLTKAIYNQTFYIISREGVVSEVEMKSIDLYTLNPTYEGFKKDLAKVEMPSRMDTKLSDWEKRNIEYARQQHGNLLRNTKWSSPITLLYNKFSKKAKSKALYYEMVGSEEEVRRLPEKYNREIVSKITGLQDDDLLNFMVFCRFSYYDIVRWSDFEIERKIESKYYDYQYYKALEDE